MPNSENNHAVAASIYPALQHYPGAERFSWSAEGRHLFSRKLLKICWWPFFIARQRRLLKTAPFRSGMPLPGFADLWKTIQKGAFAYNHLFLGLGPLQYTRRLQLADITTLALFFGDEFIDGLAEITGKSFVQELVQKNPERFFLKIVRDGHTVKLRYRFDLERLLPHGVLQQRNEKYGVSYFELYRILKEFLDLLNRELEKLPLSLAQKTAGKVADACNTCFRSFIHDNCSPHTPETLATPPEVLLFHEQKTAYMQTKLLELRCVLAEKEQAMTCIQTPGWLNIMRVIQVYDDIHDAVLDLGVQDNLLLSAARHYFPAEWEWFCQNKSLQHFRKECRVLLSLYMPGSMHYCQQLAARKIQNMNWEQQKIMHYLLLRNNYRLHCDTHEAMLPGQENFLLAVYRMIAPRLPQLSSEQIKSFVVDTCMHLPAIRNSIGKKAGLNAFYQLRYNLFSVSPAFKASLFDKLAV